MSKSQRWPRFHGSIHLSEYAFQCQWNSRTGRRTPFPKNRWVPRASSHYVRYGNLIVRKEEENCMLNNKGRKRGENEVQWCCSCLPQRPPLPTLSPHSPPCLSTWLLHLSHWLAPRAGRRLPLGQTRLRIERQMTKIAHYATFSISLTSQTAHRILSFNLFSQKQQTKDLKNYYYCLLYY